ncbi:PAS domain-containing sensor histidine kinase [Candidatus Halocynthiibacter alkanivorans]|uniref:PAS domain-containing sensor histidine kinase n=1 Tax=Candidatus Halocynthiibacter alkanivorans TaxID=2267619 RepID=UPI0013583D1B|nr:PAS domain-containing sensor histidine kinase [Candidatus Halocynthiibacter alkanivorans]
MNNADEKVLQKHRALILAATGDGVYGLDCDGNTTFSNPAAERMTGFSAEEMYGKPSHALIHHTHADGTPYPNHTCPIHAAFHDGKVHRVTGEVFWRKDGISFPVEYVSTPLVDEGELVGAVVAFRDVTEEKRAEKALLESEHRYRKIVEATHEAIFLLRVEDGVMLDANEEACRLLGFPRDVLLTKTARDLHPHELDRHKEIFDSVIENGKGRTDELTCLSSNGERIPVRMSASVIQLQGVDCLLVIVQDQRDYVEAEKRTRKLQADLHHGARLSAMGEMASGMAHELNQPLTAVMNYLQACQLILENGTDAQRGKISEYMGKAIDQAERAGKIISGLRTFVQKGEANRTVEELNGTVEEARSLMLSGVAAEDIRFQTDFAGNLAPVCVDKIQIQQVVFNLVRNGVEALAHTKDGKLLVSTARRGNGMLEVSVTDNGPGVENDFLDKLFTAFSTTKAEGMGVGLSICQSIIEDHGGSIRAERNSDAGMTFTFTLPVAAREGANV